MRAVLLRLLPFLGWIGELRQGAVVRADLVAGITVALVLIPQSMAYAQLAGLPPHLGLYAALLPVAVGALWGSSRQLATGPVAMTALLTASAVLPLAGDPAAALATAVALALLAGLIRIGLGILHLGAVVNFISHPVLVGFTNAAALIIATSQLDKLLGVTAARGATHAGTVWNVIAAAVDGGLAPTALGMGLLAIAIMLVGRRFLPRLPSVLVAVVATTVLAWATGYHRRDEVPRSMLPSAPPAVGARLARGTDGAFTADPAGDWRVVRIDDGRAVLTTGPAVVGSIPAGLPRIGLPAWDGERWRSLLATAITVSLIGILEALSISKAIALRTRQRLQIDQELIGQGLANLAAAASGAFPVSGSFSRSAVNLAAGARTGLSSVVAAAVVLLVLLCCTPLLYHLPEATLAAVIVMAVAGLVRLRPLWHAWQASPDDGVAAWATFALTLAFAPAIEWGILGGIGLALSLYLRRTMRPRTAVLARHADGTWRDAGSHGLAECEHIAMVRFDARIFFANAAAFLDAVQAALAARPERRAILLVGDGINAIDATGEEVLVRLAEDLRQADVLLALCGLKKPVTDVLERTGALDRIGRERVFRTEAEALAFVWRGIGCDHVDRCPLQTPRPVPPVAG
jgi:SulP family sulfate permease